MNQQNPRGRGRNRNRNRNANNNIRENMEQHRPNEPQGLQRVQDHEPGIRQQQPQQQPRQQHQQQQPRQQQQQQQPRQQREKYPIAFWKLNELLQCIPNILIMELEINPGWDCLLGESQVRTTEQLESMLKAFQIALKSTQKNMLLQFLHKYFSRFIFHSMSSWGMLPRDARLANLLHDFLQMLQGVCHIIPQAAAPQIRTVLMVITSISDELQKKLRGTDKSIPDLIKAIQEQTDSAAEELLKNASEQNKPKRIIHGYETSGAPPNDFREIGIYPTVDDISTERPFVRENKIAGAYQDGHEYIDTQFRLLREDFIKPLREGVQNYLGLGADLKRNKNLKSNSVRYYYNVSCRGRIAALTDQVFVYAFQLAARDYKTVDWERSKRFGNGTVIGLSSDNFKNVVFASVTNRDVHTLKKGGLSVECCRSEDEGYLEAGKVYIIIESTALFEAYRYNLKVLQEIDTDEVPMGKYIVKVEKQVGAPDFIDKNARINLSPIMKGNRSTSTEVYNDLNWPALNSTALDEVQYRALQSAFSRDMCLIQGPPGTGKTYVGLLIVETMLLNLITKKPILVVCYTNHALDQFLEGILKFSRRIVRVGGMCKNDEIKQYSLSELRAQRKESVTFQGELTARTARHYRYRLNQLRRDVNSLQEKANRALGKLMPDDVLENLSWGEIRSRDQVLKFLHVEAGSKEYLKQQLEEKKKIEAVQQARQVEENDPLRRMEEEIQSDEEDFGAADEQPDMDTRMVVERLLSLNEKKKVPGLEAYIEYELTMNDRERITQQQANVLQDILTNGRAEQLSLEQRWDLYRYWHSQYMSRLFEDAESSREEYSVVFKSLKEVESEMDLNILKEAAIIGMTTTGAAKYKNLYDRLNIDIVIVEEAAELLEAHVVTTISKSTKQLILIGDHQQLRPSTTDYQMAKKFNLEISLFERLINNGLPYVRLELQHRMRPEFTKLLVPHIYPSLECGPRVYEYESICGMSSNLQLMNHTEMETHDKENRSKSNQFECDIVVGLVKYLVLQGYTHDQITVLAMYSGQQFMIKKIMRDSHLTVRVTSVDNYQGEENDIVIISFVRSNEDSIIGFVGTINRLCVAFSRARKGLFCIGNFIMIASKMPTFNNMLESVGNSVSDHFKLRCRNHGRETCIYNKKDFELVSEGGCQEPCNVRLDCGHACPKQCHVYDYNHEKFKCPGRCTKTLDCGHQCLKNCSDNCGNCITKIEKVLPACGHRCEILCGASVDDFECAKKCQRPRPCGHPCPRACGKPCIQSCYKEVKVQALCGHMVTVKCCDRADSFKVMSACKEPCNQMLQCEHVCNGTCGGCSQGRLHEPCKSRCDKQLICGHTCKEPCSQECPPCKQKCENSCMHSKCNKKCGEPCIPCAEPCARLCQHQKCNQICSNTCSVEPCNQRCSKQLKCGHQCIGFCTDDCPKKCSECCRKNEEDVADLILGTEEEDSIYVKLDCGHIIESEGMHSWVETQCTSDEISAGSIKCPLCSSVVKKCNRYIREINTKRLLIERVKQISFGSPSMNRAELLKLLRRIREVDGGFRDNRQPDELYVAQNPLLRELQRQIGLIKVPDKMILNQWNNLLEIIEETNRIEAEIHTYEIFTELPALELIWEALKRAVERAIGTKIGQQQLNDMTTELLRFTKLPDLKKELTADATSKRNPLLKDCVDLVCSFKCYSDDKHTKLKQMIAEIHKKRTGTALGISDKEKKMILSAMGLKQGHWYACPNGHPYCITECGGAMVESKCNECGATIGGGSHTLRRDNRVATEMDGANHPAWSEHYNDMRNFRF